MSYRIVKFELETYSSTRLKVKSAGNLIPEFLDNVEVINSQLTDISHELRILTQTHLRSSDFINSSNQIIYTALNISNYFKTVMLSLLNDTLERINAVSTNSKAESKQLEEAKYKLEDTLRKIENVYPLTGSALIGGYSSLYNDFGVQHNENGEIIYPFNAEVKGQLGIPRYFQYNPEYQDASYAGKTIAKRGCGITSAAMVIAGINDDPTITPEYLANEVAELNVPGTLIDKMLTELDLHGIDHKGASFKECVAALDSGKAVIVSAPRTGYAGIPELDQHLLVFAGKNENGLYEVNDPASYSFNSNQYKWYPNGFKNGFTEDQLRPFFGCGWIVSAKE